MCGICGFFQAEPRADERTLRAMNDRIVHRGPDDEGSYFDGRAGLAARRLSIIDLSTGHQPLCSASGNCWIAYNGEVYNFDELRRELISRGVPFRTRSDTEVVVNLYEEFGIDFVRRLRGMFAFAIFDRKNDRLVLARDRIGKKPLYYALLPADAGLVFASEIKALLEYPGHRTGHRSGGAGPLSDPGIHPRPRFQSFGASASCRPATCWFWKTAKSPSRATGTWNGGTRKRVSPNFAKNSSACWRNRSGSG